MGQRSQTYVMWTRKDTRRTFVGKYHQWLYGRTFLSTGAGIIMWLDRELEHPAGLDINPKYCTETLDAIKALMDVACHYVYVSKGRDILEVAEPEEDIFADCANNDGQLYIMVTPDKKKIKYCFTDDQIFNLDKVRIMDCHEWFEWDYGYLEDHKKMGTLLDEEEVKQCFEIFDTTAELMTRDELRDFRSYDYKKEEKNAENGQRPGNLES